MCNTSRLGYSFVLESRAIKALVSSFALEPLSILFEFCTQIVNLKLAWNNS